MTLLLAWREIAIGLLLVACAVLYGISENRSAQIAKKAAEAEQYKSAYMTLAKAAKAFNAEVQKMKDDEKIRLQEALQARKNIQPKLDAIRDRKGYLMGLKSRPDGFECKRAEEILDGALNDEV